MSQEQHDPFTEVDFEEEIKKNHERLKDGCSKLFQNFSNQIKEYIQANHIDHICLEIHVSADGRTTGRHLIKPNMPKILDTIEKGEPQAHQ